MSLDDEITSDDPLFHKAVAAVRKILVQLEERRDLAKEQGFIRRAEELEIVRAKIQNILYGFVAQTDEKSGEK